MQLPKCTSFESFASCMAISLRLGDYMSRTEAQNEERLSQEELRVVLGAMRGEARAGGYYRCRCGYPHWKLATSLLVLMALSSQLGLKASSKPAREDTRSRW